MDHTIYLNKTIEINRNILSIDLIKAEGKRESSRIWEFSDMDSNCLKMHLRGTWIYDSALDIDQLKSSLGKLLNYYEPLAGRINREKSGIVMVNRGVPFIVKEETKISVHDILKTDEWANRFTTPLNIDELKKGNIAPMNVTVSMLNDGTVVSVQCTHGLTDGGSFYTMVNDWGKLFRNEQIQPPVIDQSVFSIEQTMSKDKILQSVTDLGWKKVTFATVLKMFSMSITGIDDKKTDPFYFSPTSINRLKEKISIECGFRCSTNIALSAFIGKMYMILNNLPPETEYTEAVVINLRNRFEGIPIGFFGNASTAIPTGAFKRTSTLSEIAQVIHDSLNPMLNGPTKKVTDFFTLNLAAMSAGLPYTSMDLDSMNSLRPLSFYNNNFSKLPIYMVDFGKGEPIMVIPHNLSSHQMLIWPVSSSKDDGVDIYFSGLFAHKISRLKKDDPWLLEMKKFEK